MSSPSITPRSPLSPQYPMGPSCFTESCESSANSSRKHSDSSQSRHTVDKPQNVFTYQSGSDTQCDARQSNEEASTEDDQEDEDLSSVSCDSIDDKLPMPRGRRPPPMIISQEDLPEFVAGLSPKNSLKRLLQRSLDLDERYSTVLCSFVMNCCIQVTV